MSSVVASVNPEVLHHRVGHARGENSRTESRSRPIPARVSLARVQESENDSIFLADEASPPTTESGIALSLRAARNRKSPDQRRSKSKSSTPAKKSQNVANAELLKGLDRTGSMAASEALNHMVGTPPKQQVLTRTAGKRPATAKNLLRGTSSHGVLALGMQLDGPLKDGLNGAYLCRDSDGGKWVFKPLDEEGYKRPEELEEDEREETLHEVIVFDGQIHKLALRRGVIHGDTVKKEEAAFSLDDGFAGVPRTFTAHIQLENDKGESELKYGSLQEYVEHVGSAEEMGPNFFNTEDVHRIGVLDIRLLNLDRHLGNLLVVPSRETPPALTGLGSDGSKTDNQSRGGYRLIPIDHGFILPDFRHTGDVNLEWLHWKQCKEPFSPETLAYIDALNPLQDALKLKQLNIRDEEVLTSLTTTMLLRKGAARGLTLYELGSIVQRPEFDTKSTLEKIVDQAIQHTALEPGLRSEGPSPSCADLNHLEEGAPRSLREGKDGIHIPAGSPCTDSGSLDTSPLTELMSSPPPSSVLLPLPEMEGLARIPSYISESSDECGSWPPDGSLSGGSRLASRSTSSDMQRNDADSDSSSWSHERVIPPHSSRAISSSGQASHDSEVPEKRVSIGLESGDKCNPIGPAYEPSRNLRRWPCPPSLGLQPFQPVGPKPKPRVTFAHTPTSESKNPRFENPPRRKSKPRTCRYRDPLADFEPATHRRSKSTPPKNIPKSPTASARTSKPTLKRSQSFANVNSQKATSILMQRVYAFHAANPAKERLGVMLTPSKSCGALLDLDDSPARPRALLLPGPSKARVMLEFDSEHECDFELEEVEDDIPSPITTFREDGSRETEVPCNMSGSESDDGCDSGSEHSPTHPFGEDVSDWGGDADFGSLKDLPRETGTWVHMYIRFIMQAIDKVVDDMLHARKEPLPAVPNLNNPRSRTSS
eukprot:gb/GEZN01001040.1/.p1 GENE.gb/GEZN01001040.1/~~gb/GEZN01001040.1/.p1  ORF type:complete len:937 (+),score=63.25 gb/GEZN01001040.1/:373-3183(+)